MIGFFSNNRKIRQDLQDYLDLLLFFVSGRNKEYPIAFGEEKIGRFACTGDGIVSADRRVWFSKFRPEILKKQKNPQNPVNPVYNK